MRFTVFTGIDSDRRREAAVSELLYGLVSGEREYAGKVIFVCDAHRKSG